MVMARFLAALDALSFFALLVFLFLAAVGFSIIKAATTQEANDRGVLVFLGSLLGSALMISWLWGSFSAWWGAP